LTIPLKITDIAARLSHRGYNTTVNVEQNTQRIPITTQTEKPVTLYTVEAPNRGIGMIIRNTNVCKRKGLGSEAYPATSLLNGPYHDHRRPHSKSKRFLEAHRIKVILELGLVGNGGH
jgi:hypothetical protein